MLTLEDTNIVKKDDVKKSSINTSRGSLLSQRCCGIKGFDLVNILSNGRGGTYERVVEFNSTKCGYEIKGR